MAADGDVEFWTDEEIGEYLRRCGHTLKDSSVSAWRAERKIRATARSSAAEVREAERQMVGRGRYLRRRSA